MSDVLYRMSRLACLGLVNAPSSKIMRYLACHRPPSPYGSGHLLEVTYAHGFHQS